MRFALGITLALMAATPGNALTPAWIMCQNPNGTIADYIYVNDAEDEWLPDMTTFTMRPTDPDADDVTEVIVHCATRQAVFYEHELNDDAYDLLRASMQGSEAVTLRQLARRLKRKGVDAKFGTLAKAHCACRPETHKSSF